MRPANIYNYMNTFKSINSNSTFMKSQFRILSTE